MDKKNKKYYRTFAKVVSIDTTRVDLSSENAHQNNAFVEFTDYKGDLAKESFRICDSPLFTTIRINSIVEIEYTENNIFGGYVITLLNPELYERVPTEEELIPYKRNKKRVALQCLMGFPAFFITLVLFKLTRSPLVIIAFFVVTYFIMKFGSKQAHISSDKVVTWRKEDSE